MLAPTKQAGQAANPGISAGEAAWGESQAAAAGEPAPHRALPAPGTMAAGWCHPVGGEAVEPSVQWGHGEGASCAPDTAVVGVP